jgi:hypothetical protein
MTLVVCATELPDVPIGRETRFVLITAVFQLMSTVARSVADTPGQWVARARDGAPRNGDDYL